MGDWCASWSSKPVWGVKSVLGGFDSHMPSPKKNILMTAAACDPAGGSAVDIDAIYN